ncbi:MAG: hypothetical protein MAG458_01235 [Nitrosopumilus sp.]|nr:hypothetical protein [Nitrosopumilus sp.]
MTEINSLVQNLKDQNVKIIPVKFKSKIPDVLDFSKYLSGEKTYDKEILANQNYGAICGKISDNLGIIDIEKIHSDDYHNKVKHPRHIPIEDGFIDKIIPDCKNQTLTTKTGSDCYHILVKFEKLPDKTTKLIWEKDPDNTYQIDFKVTGQCVEAGSTYENGKMYEMVSNVRTIKKMDIQDVLKRLDKIGFKGTGKVLNNELTNFNNYEIDDLLKGKWHRGERRRKQKSLYCKLRRERKTDLECREIILSILDNLSEPLDKNEIDYNFDNAMYFFESEILPTNGYVDNTTKAEIFKLQKLTEIDEKQYANKTIKVKAVIASNSISYNIPTNIKVFCNYNKDNHNCIGTTEISINSNDFAKFVEIPDYKREKILQGLCKSKFTSDCRVGIIETASTTIRRLRIRPVISSLYKKDSTFFDDEGNEWSAYDVYVLQNEIKNLEAGKEVEVTGKVIADPKTGKITILISEINYIDENKYDLELVKKLKQKHHGKSLVEIMSWYTREFSKFSKIVKRENITELGLFSMFSPLYIEFDGKIIPAWIKSVIIGDSTTGKSETIRQLIILCRAGQIISGEMASVAGLAGASVQASGGQWFTDFGTLVLNDKKFLAIDGAHKLKKDEMDRLAEAERNGKIEINKAAKGEAYARTRQTKILNPLDEDGRTTVAMDSFLYPIHSLQHSFQIQSIARIDLCVFVSDDVNVKERNVRTNEKYDNILEYLADLLRLVWSKNYIVTFEDDANQEILDQAIILENNFKNDDYPLITNDQKYKLAKLSVSLACLTCSFNYDFTKVIVTKQHVQYISEMINREYTNAGLREIAKQSQFSQIDSEKLYEITENMNKKINEDKIEIPIEILKWIARQSKITREEIMEEFTLSRDKQAQPLLTFLKNEKILKTSRNHYSIAKKGVAIARFIDNFSHPSVSRPSKIDTPKKNSNNFRGVSLLVELERLERLKIHTFQCSDCNTEWKNTKQTLEDVIQEHDKSHTISILEAL